LLLNWQNKNHNSYRVLFNIWDEWPTYIFKIIKLLCKIGINPSFITIIVLYCIVLYFLISKYLTYIQIFNLCLFAIISINIYNYNLHRIYSKLWKKKLILSHQMLHHNNLSILLWFILILLNRSFNCRKNLFLLMLELNNLYLRAIYPPIFLSIKLE